MAGTKLIEDSIWTWYNTPVAVYDSGKLYVGTWSAANAFAQVHQIHLANADIASKSLYLPLMETDDHDNPALVLQASGKLLACWSYHNGDSYCAATDATAHVHTFGSTVNVQTGAADDSYAQVIENTISGGNQLIWFHRKSIASHYYQTSTDGGVTWNSPVSFFDVSGERPYFRFWKTSSTRIDFACTNGHPNEVTANIYHGYIVVDTDGTLDFYKSDGTSIGNESALPLDAADVTSVYSSRNSWIWDMKDVGGTKVANFASFTTTSVTGDTHHYHQARWNGSSWVSEEICEGGNTSTTPHWLYSTEGYYSGGICQDPNDIDVVYVSRKYGSGDWRIEKWTHSGTFGSGSWSKTTDMSGNTSSVNARPVAIDCGGTTRVLWWAGTYTSYTSYNTDVYIDGGVTWRTAKPASPSLNSDYAPYGTKLFLPCQNGSGAPTDLMGTYTPSMTGTVTWTSDTIGYYLSGWSTSNYISFDSVASAFEAGSYPKWMAVMFTSTSSSSAQLLVGFTGTTDTPFSFIRLNVSGSNQLTMESRDDSSNLGQAIASTSVPNDGNIHVAIGVEWSSSRRAIYLDGSRLQINTTSVGGTRSITRGTLGLQRRATSTNAATGRIYASAVGWGGAPNPGDLTRDWNIGNFSGATVASAGTGHPAGRRLWTNRGVIFRPVEFGREGALIV